MLAEPEANAEELAILQGAESGADALTVRANNREYYSQGASAALGFRFGEGIVHEVQLGVRFHHDEEDVPSMKTGSRCGTGVMELTSAGAPGTQSNRVSDASATSVYLEDEITIDRLRITPGVRFETGGLLPYRLRLRRPEASRRKASTAEQRIGSDSWLGLTYSMAGNTHLFGGCPPRVRASRPRIRSENGTRGEHHYEIGLRLRPIRDERAGIDVLLRLHQHPRNSHARHRRIGYRRAVQRRLGSRSGVEVAAAYDLLWQRAGAINLPVQVSYTFTDAEFRNGFESDFGAWGTVEPGDQLPYLPRQQFAASADLRGVGWKWVSGCHWQLGHADGRRAGSDSAGPVHGPLRRLDSKRRIRAAVGGHAVRRGVQNLLDRKYVVARRPAGARPGLPQTLTVGYRLSW